MMGFTQVFVPQCTKLYKKRTRFLFSQSQRWHEYYCKRVDSSSVWFRKICQGDGRNIFCSCVWVEAEVFWMQKSTNGNCDSSASWLHMRGFISCQMTFLECTPATGMLVASSFQVSWPVLDEVSAGRNTIVQYTVIIYNLNEIAWCILHPAIREKNV